MQPALICFGAISALELGLWLPMAWRWRRVLACITLVAVAVISGWLLAEGYHAWQWLLVFFSAYRVINLLRLVEGRSPAAYLRRSGRQATIWLLVFQAVTLLTAWLGHQAHANLVAYIFIIVVVGLLLGLTLLASTLRQLRTTRPPLITEHSATRDMPSLTVAIPARNETDDLDKCLQSLTGSTYPKLEIIVLDDCSQERRTPEIIRGFAQQGVRFIAGKVPPDHWLAKNYAYEQLAEAANGELLLFCGVDARFTPDSLLALVETLLYKHKTMLGVLPRNHLPKRRSIGSLLVQPGRYAWEMALPRRLLQRPPVLSTCWLIKAALLHEAGGFKAVTNSIAPESYFAKYAVRHDDGYSFVSSNEILGVKSDKSLPEQLATAVRTRYPALHRRPELVALTGLIELGLVLGPYIALVAAIIGADWALAVVALVPCLAFIIVNGLITTLTYRKFLWRSLFLAPVAPLFDCCLLNYSMWQYEFGEVIWKDRNICVPVVRTNTPLK